jgi:hypothetical protein
MSMHKYFRFMLVLLLPVIAGCSGMGTIGFSQDNPESINRLLEEHEYARARQLTSKHASLDTPELQTRIIKQEASFEENTYSEARTLESENDLLGAVQLLSSALQKLPHSASLRKLRNTIEQERVKQLQTNEREQLIVRAKYALNQQQLYRKQANLESPSLGQRWENQRNQKETITLSTQLLQHGQQAMDEDKADLAKTCLLLSQALNETPEVDALLSIIHTDEESRKQVNKQENRLAQKKVNIRKEKNRKKEQQDQKKKTEVLLAETQQALAKDDLQVARAAFVQIPPSAVSDSIVQATQDDLDHAVDVYVGKLITQGDTQYRADNVLLAVRTWTKALSLDPDNRELRERVERANKVLARLEELKRQQHRQNPLLNLPIKPTRVRATSASPQR